MDHKLSDFDYHLPEGLIAQSPAEPRDSSRLLLYRRQDGQIQDQTFRDITDFLGENDVLVVNQTRVIKARLKGFITPKSGTLLSSFEEGGVRRTEGAAIVGGGTDSEVSLRPCEIFLHKQLSDTTWECLVYPGKKLKPGAKVVFGDTFHHSPLLGGEGINSNLQPHLLPLGEELGGGLRQGEELGEEPLLAATILSLTEHGRIVEFSKSGQEFFDIIDRIGETPLPPYIKDHSSEAERYQTVYHDKAQAGSVAAPTAGLHFTPELLQKLEDKGVKIEKVTLHVGLGTFKNVEVEYIKNHTMHSEKIFIEQDVAQRLNAYKQAGKRIIAVGTTSVRTLESFANPEGILEYGHKDTSIFITPGYEWRFVDSIITNFHLPKSTLLMLVSSFIEYAAMKKVYEHAVDSQYRFFSFGDAMWLY